MASAREKHKFKNTLVCLLKAMEGVKTTVELRNENVVTGQIVSVDARMHLTMENVIFKPVKGPEIKFSDFFVQGHHIRYVHIPDYIDIRKVMEKQLLAGQSVYTNIGKAKDERMRVKQIRAEKREFQRLKKEARSATQTNVSPQTSQIVTSDL